MKLNSSNFEKLKDYTIKELMNRYCVCKVKPSIVLPPNQICNIIQDSDKDEISRKDSLNSIDEDILNEWECNIYSSGKIIFAMVMRQSTQYTIDYKICVNLDKDEEINSPIHCLNAFRLPKHYKYIKNNISIQTAILIVFETQDPKFSKIKPEIKYYQGMKIIDDRGKDIAFEFTNESEKQFYQGRIIWVTSHNAPDDHGWVKFPKKKYISYDDNTVQLFSFEFDQPSCKVTPTITFLANYKYPELPIYFDTMIGNRHSKEELLLHNQDSQQSIQLKQDKDNKITIYFKFHLLLTSFEGMIAHIELDLKSFNDDKVWKLQFNDSNKNKQSQIFMSQYVSQPKFIPTKIVDHSIEAIVPLSNNLIHFQGIEEYGLKKRELILLRKFDDIQNVIIAFDFSQMKTNAEQYFACFMYNDGKLRVYQIKLKDNENDQTYSQLSLNEKVDQAFFYVFTCQFQNRNFILSASHHSMRVYEFQNQLIN